MILGVGHLDRRTQRIAGTDENAHLEFVVQARDWRRTVGLAPLADRWPCGRRKLWPDTPIEELRP